jgi:hypothetical protein
MNRGERGERGVTAVVVKTEKRQNFLLLRCAKVERILATLGVLRVLGVLRGIFTLRNAPI